MAFFLCSGSDAMVSSAQRKWRGFEGGRIKAGPVLVLSCRNGKCGKCGKDGTREREMQRKSDPLQCSLGGKILWVKDFLEISC